MPLVSCPVDSGAYTVSTECGKLIENHLMLQHVQATALIHRVEAKTTPEFDQWAKDFQVEPVALILDRNQGVLFHLMNDRDATMFKLRWQ